MYDEARAIALQMERLITDIGQYGTMIEQATAALDEPIDSNVEYRDRQRQMYADYQAAWDSQGRDSHRAFLRMINDPDQRAEFEADVAAVAEALPALDPALRKVMAGFFELVGHQIDEVERIQQRCAQRVKRFTAFGTLEQSRGVARQLNEAIGAARALLKASLTDSRLDLEPPAGPAHHQFGGRAELPDRRSVQPETRPGRRRRRRPVQLRRADHPGRRPGNVGDDQHGHRRRLRCHYRMRWRCSTGAYLGHVIVLWSWALKQTVHPEDSARAAESVTVRFQSLDGRDREMEVPHLMFTEPISSLLGAAS